MLKTMSNMPASRSGNNETLPEYAPSKFDMLVQVALTCLQTEVIQEDAVTCRGNTKDTTISDFDVELADVSRAVFISAEDKKNKSSNTDKQSRPATKGSSDYSHDKWKCDSCSRQFSSSGILMKHKRVMHNRKKLFICEICDMRLSRADALKRHKETKHQPDRKFACNVCSARFKTRDILKQHMLIHGNNPLHECQECHRKFRRKPALKHHMLCHGKGTSFLCEKCNIEFVSTSDIAKHNMDTHNIGTPSPCQYCGKIFTKKEILRKHIATRHADRQDNK